MTQAPFGKNPDSLPSLGHGESSGYGDLPGGGGGGGGNKSGGNRGPFLMNFSPHVGGPAFWLVLHYGQWQNIYYRRDEDPVVRSDPYKRTFRHYHSTVRKFTTCSGGPDYHNASVASELCSGCAIYYANRKWIEDPKNPHGGHFENGGPVNRSEEFTFSISVLETFYGVPGLRLNPKTNTPYDEWVLRGDSRLPDHRTPQGKELLAKMRTKQGMPFLLGLNRSKFSVFLGGGMMPKGASIDERLRRYCVKCKGEDTILDMNGTDICGACDSRNSRAHLFNTAVQLEAVVSGNPQKPGQRAPFTYNLKSWLPLEEMMQQHAGGRPLFEPSLFESADLEVKCAPTPPSAQAAIYGMPPARTSQGSTRMVAPPQDLPPQDDGDEGNDDDLPSLAAAA